MMVELGENAPVYSLLPKIKNYQIAKPLRYSVVGGKVGYQAWQKLSCVGLELVCHEFLGESGIWTSFHRELCCIVV